MFAFVIGSSTLIILGLLFPLITRVWLREPIPKDYVPDYLAIVLIIAVFWPMIIAVGVAALICWGGLRLFCLLWGAEE